MNDPIKDVRLSFQCPEDWNCMKKMNDTERHCAKCQHAVHDFTNATTAELAAALSSGTRVCGRFKQSQLSSGFLKYAAATVIAASVLACEPTPITPAEIEVQIPMEEEVEVEIELSGIVIQFDTEIETDSLQIDIENEIEIEVEPDSTGGN